MNEYVNDNVLSLKIYKVNMDNQPVSCVDSDYWM